MRSPCVLWASIWPGTECAACGGVTVRTHAAGWMIPCLEVWTYMWGSCHPCTCTILWGESAGSHRRAGPPRCAHPCQSVRLQIWFPSSSNRQLGWGRLSGILIVLLHVAELHECGGRREQPEAMWGMRGKPQERGALGFTGTLRRRQSPETQKSGWQGEGEGF